MENKVWFVMLKGKKNGPFSIDELKRMWELTPDSLAWREGMADWRPIREIPELKVLFEEENESILTEEVGKNGAAAEGLALILPQIQPPTLFWFLFFILIILYVLFQFYYS